MKTYIILVCGINIRALNQIGHDEQLHLLNSVPDLVSVEAAGDKGSYLVKSEIEPSQLVARIIGVLRSQCPGIKEAGIAAPGTVKNALNQLTAMLTQYYGHRFSFADFGISLDDGKWRAGLAFPVYPESIPKINTPNHQTKNARFFGLVDGAALVAKREAKNVHWGSTVNDPIKRLVKRQTGVSVQLTSRSAKTLRDLVTLYEARRV